VYEELEDSEGLSYIKVINLASKVSVRLPVVD
jgi:hypothetical protein